MRTVGDLVRYFRYHVERRPRHEVDECIAHYLGLQRLELSLFSDRVVCNDEYVRIGSAMQYLSRGVPLAYVLGISFFYDDFFLVNEHTLIPRPETEVVVDVARSYMSEQPAGTLVDVCTGSGCIGLSLKKIFPNWRVILSDYSKEALEVAKNNAFTLGLDVDVVHGDLLEPFFDCAVDAVVANPPYVSSADWDALDDSVRMYEPKCALVGGETGVEVYVRMAEQITRVCPRFFVFEIGIDQASTISSLFPYSVACCRDLSGRDRVLHAQACRF